MSMVITALGGQKVNIWGLMKGLLGLLNPWVLFLTRILGGRSLRASHTQFLGEERIPARCFPAPFTISGQAGPEEGVALPGPPTSLSPQRRWPSAKEAHLQYSQVWERTGMEASSHMSKQVKVPIQGNNLVNQICVLSPNLKNVLPHQHSRQFQSLEFQPPQSPTPQCGIKEMVPKGAKPRPLPHSHSDPTRESSTSALPTFSLQTAPLDYSLVGLIFRSLEAGSELLG